MAATAQPREQAAVRAGRLREARVDLQHAQIGRALAPLGVALGVEVLVAASCGGAAYHLGVELEHARGGEEDDDLVPGSG